jgi:hypothetical protein
VHDIAHADHLLVRLGSDDALSGSDKQHVIAAMDVHFILRTNTEIDDGKIKSLLISAVSSVSRVTGPMVAE